MHIERSKPERASTGDRNRLLMVSLGILLFVSGFLMTLSSINDGRAGASSDDNAPSRTDSGFGGSDSALGLSGLLVSIVGVVLATVGPAVGIVRGKT